MFFPLFYLFFFVILFLSSADASNRLRRFIDTTAKSIGKAHFVRFIADAIKEIFLSIFIVYCHFGQVTNCYLVSCKLRPLLVSIDGHAICSLFGRLLQSCLQDDRHLLVRFELPCEGCGRSFQRQLLQHLLL